MSDTRYGCTYCFITLDPQVHQAEEQQFVVCQNCGAVYHQECWNRQYRCVAKNCESTSTVSIKMQPPPPLIVHTRTRALLPQPTQIVYDKQNSTTNSSNSRLLVIVLLGLMIITFFLVGLWGGILFNRSNQDSMTDQTALLSPTSPDKIVSNESAEGSSNSTETVPILETREPVIASPDIVPREAWRAAPATGASGAQTPMRLVLSHDGQPIDSTTDSVRLIQTIQRLHQERGWPDIAWHYIIDQHGIIYQGHNPTDRGDTGYYFDTTGIITIGVLGDYDSQVPSTAQIDAIVDLMTWLCQTYDISTEEIYPHSYFANQSPQTNPKITSPGRNFDLTDIKRQVSQRLGQ